MSVRSATRRNYILYSVPMLLLLTACLLCAEHLLPKQVHAGNIDVDALVSKQSGRLPRQIAYIVMGMVGVAGILDRRRNRKLHWHATPLIVVFLLLLGWSVLSVIWTDTPETTAKRLLVLVLMFSGALGLVLNWSHVQVLKFIALSAAIQVSVGVAAEVISGYFTPFDSSYRFAGTLPWNSQGYLCLCLILSALCMIRTKGSNRWLYQMLCGYGLLMLLLTRSRGALLALTVSLVVVFLVSTNAKLKLVSLLLGFAAVMMILTWGVGDNLVKVLNRGGEGSQDFTGRAPLWAELMSYVHRRPWIGYGYEGFWTEKMVAVVSSDQKWAIDTAHSGYVEDLLGLGIIGVLLHTLTLLFGAREGIRLFRSTGDYSFLLGATLCCSYLVGGFLEALSVVKTSQSSFYFAMALCLIAKGALVSQGSSPSAVVQRSPVMQAGSLI